MRVWWCTTGALCGAPQIFSNVAMTRLMLSSGSPLTCRGKANARGGGGTERAFHVRVRTARTQDTAVKLQPAGWLAPARWSARCGHKAHGQTTECGRALDGGGTRLVHWAARHTPTGNRHLAKLATVGRDLLAGGTSRLAKPKGLRTDMADCAKNQRKSAKSSTPSAPFPSALCTCTRPAEAAAPPDQVHGAGVSRRPSPPTLTLPATQRMLLPRWRP